jgi:hypothetical protein
MGKTHGEPSPRGRAWVVLGAAGAAGVAVGVLRGVHRAAKSVGRGEGPRQGALRAYRASRSRDGSVCSPPAAAAAHSAPSRFHEVA